MRALVTGCSGFIGSHLSESLLDDGHAVLGVDCFNDNYGRRDKLANLRHAQDWDDFEFVPLDLSRGALEEIIGEVDVIFHLAGEPGVRPSWGTKFEQYVRNNVMATQHLLQAAALTPEKVFVYASSSSVYGQADSFPTSETTLPKPFSPYGMTKLAAEHLCQLYHGNYSVPTVSLRYFSVYGPRQRPDMAFNRFCRAVAQREPIDVYGDGNQTRDFTYVADVVAATRAAAVTPAAIGRVFNIGGGSRVTLRTTIDILQELAGAKLDVRYTAPQLGDVRDTGADTTAAEEILSFRPGTGIQEGLAEEFEWMLGRIRIGA